VAVRRRSGRDAPRGVGRASAGRNAVVVVVAKLEESNAFDPKAEPFGEITLAMLRI